MTAQLRKSGVRPIMPQLARAQWDIMIRRRSRSSKLRGMIWDNPTLSPLLGEV